MLTAQENERLTRVGPGTPMRGLLERYWYPVLFAHELAAGGDPLRVRLLGENYVAFRADDGRVGLLDEGCPHRGASLLLARNAGCALTCIFHGWKIGVDGRVLEVPTERADGERFRNTVKVRHYPVREAGGLIWAYVGGGEPTQFPDFEFASLPPEHVTILKIPVDCNWLQGVEGLIDSAHVGQLHSDTLDTVYLRDDGGSAQTKTFLMADRAPTFDVHVADYGMQVAAVRSLGDGRKFVRVSAIVMPTWTFIPQPLDEDFLGIGQVPVDDTHSIQWYVMYNTEHPIDRTSLGHGFQSMLGYDGASYAAAAPGDARWGQDRRLMASGHATGFKNIMFEDLAVIRSMGPIVDRTRESLGSSDAGITRYRRLLLDAVRMSVAGTVPRGLESTLDYRRIRAAQTVYAENADWRDAIAPLAAR